MSALFSCREAVRLATEAMEHRLSFRRRTEMHIHFVLCSTCRVYRRQVRSLELLIRRKFRQAPSDSSDTLSREARERINHALRAAAEK